MSSSGYSARFSPQVAATQPVDVAMDTDRVRRERELSLETNRRRKLLAERKRQLLLLEQERINSALAQRKETVRQATARYQHNRSASLTRQDTSRATPTPTPVDSEDVRGGFTRQTANDTDRSSSRAEVIRYIQQHSQRPEVVEPQRTLVPGRSTFRLDVPVSSTANAGSLRRSVSVDGLAVKPFENSPYEQPRGREERLNQGLGQTYRYPATQAEPNLHGEENRRVQMTNNHIVMTKYGVLPSEQSHIDSPIRYAARGGVQSEQESAAFRAFQEKTRAFEDQLSRLTLNDQPLSDSLEQEPDDTRWAAPVPVPVPVPAQVPLRHDAAELHANPRRVATMTAANSKRETPALLQLRRRGSVTDVQPDADRADAFDDGEAQSNGNSTQIRGILKNMRRSSSVDNLGRLASRAGELNGAITDQKARDIRDSVEVTNFRIALPLGRAQHAHAHAHALDDNAFSKKSVRFAESNSETVIDCNEDASSVRSGLGQLESDQRKQYAHVTRMNNVTPAMGNGQVSNEAPPKLALHVMSATDLPPSKLPVSTALAKRNLSVAVPAPAPAVAKPPPHPHPHPHAHNPSAARPPLPSKHTLTHGRNDDGTPQRADSIYDGIDFNTVRTPTDAEINALWATVRDYLRHAPETPVLRTASLASSSSYTNQTASTLTAQNMSGVLDGTMLGLAGPQVRALRTMNATSGKPPPPPQLRGQAASPTSGHHHHHQQQQTLALGMGTVALPQSGLSSGQTSPHIWPSLHPNPNVRRKPPAAANRTKPRRVNEDALLHLAKQVALQKQKQTPGSAHGSQQDPAEVDQDVTNSLQQFLQAEELAARSSTTADSIKSYMTVQDQDPTTSGTSRSSVGTNRSAASAPPMLSAPPAHSNSRHHTRPPQPKFTNDAGGAARAANSRAAPTPPAPASTLSVEEQRIMQSIARLDQHLRNFK